MLYGVSTSFAHILDGTAELTEEQDQILARRAEAELRQKRLDKYEKGAVVCYSSCLVIVWTPSITE